MSFNNNEVLRAVLRILRAAQLFITETEMF